MVNYIYYFSYEYWIVLSAFLVCVTSRGTPFKQGMIILMTMVIAMATSFFLRVFIKQSDLIFLVFAILFMGSNYLTFINRPLSRKRVFVTMVFAITLLIATLPVTSADSLDFFRGRVFDAVIGAFIAMICRLLLLPSKLDVEFSKGVLPILHSLSEYSQALTDNLADSVKDNLAEKRLKVESALLEMYPSWIYETGFNRGLRSGFRFFLVNVERMTESYFSMDDLEARGLDARMLRELHGQIVNVMNHHHELLSILIEYFQRKTIRSTLSDFTSDMADLEKAVHNVMPDNIEVLAVSPQFLAIAAFVRDMKDLRGLLLQLVMALPVEKEGVLEMTTKTGDQK
jgi:hypothetical protein